MMLLTCSGANRIGSTISVLPISKIMTSLGRQDGHHERHGPSSVCRRVRRGARCVLLRSPPAAKPVKELENGAASVQGFLLLLDRVFLGDAKEKSEVVPR